MCVVVALPPNSWSSAPPCRWTYSWSLLDLSIQLSISKKRMKLDLPEPLAPISTVAWGISDISTSARERNPRILMDSILIVLIEHLPN